MKCVNCENKSPLKKEVKTIKYEESGLDNVIVNGVAVYECPVCHEAYYQFPNIEKLHKAIAKALILKKGLLTGKETVYLRKYLGFSRTQFSNFLEIDYAHLNRVEKEHEGYNVSKTIDKVLRLMIAAKIECAPYEIVDSFNPEKPQLISFKRLTLEHKNSDWEIAA